MVAREPILYRWWDADGRLLYVGKSISLFARMQDHRRGSKFFAEAAAMTIQRFENELALAQAEMDAIRDEAPIYNVMGRRGGQTRRIVFADEAPPTFREPAKQTGHWVPLDQPLIFVGQIIRWDDASDEVRIGYVDDQFFDEDEADALIALAREDGGEPDELAGVGWRIITDTGEVHDLTAFDAGLCRSIDKWVDVLNEGEMHDRILSAYYSRLRVLHAA